MTTRLIFAIGTAPNRPTCYDLDGDRCETSFSGLAACELFARRAARRGEAAVETAHVLVTDAARAANLDALRAVWPAEVPLEVVDVPQGGGADDFWALFERIAALVGDGDRLVLDITQGFRSLPFVALLVASYLSAARTDARLAMLSYGAFDAQHDGVTPLYDLTPMASLLDWTAAVHHFDRGGDASTLSSLIKALNTEVQKAAVDRTERPVALGKLQSTLDRFALDLRTFRYEDAVKTAEALRAALDEALASPVDRRVVRPLAALTPRLLEALAPFEEPSPVSALTDLRRHADVMEWLYRRGQFIPYIAMLSESLVGLAASELGLYDQAGADPRRIRVVHHMTSIVVSGAEKLLSERRKPTGRVIESKRWQAKPGDAFEATLAGYDLLALSDRLLGLPLGEPLTQLAERVRPVRNSLMHAAMSTDSAPEDGPGMRDTIAGLRTSFRELVAEHGLAQMPVS